jgi:hypothetical protein
VTLEEVYALAAAMEVHERWQIWKFCGEHDHSTLSPIAGAAAPPPRYCPDCLTAWTASGAALNEPRRPDAP